MVNILSGIKSLDKHIDAFYIGENIVWEVESSIPFQHFIKAFIRQAYEDKANIIYVSFNHSPQTILADIESLVDINSFILIDCFSCGKGKKDPTFLKFYKNTHSLQVIKIEEPSDIKSFIYKINEIEDKLPTGARYIFDSLTGMQDLWGNEESTYKFFTYMCPRLYDLETVAYWILEKDAHSIAFKANVRHITQVVIDLYTRKDKMYIKALKANNRENRHFFKPHQLLISSGQIDIESIDKDKQFIIGDTVKELRNRLNISQKELAQRLDLTPSFISQIENNQISPSVHSLMQICKALDVSPSIFFQEPVSFTDKPYILIKSQNKIEINNLISYQEYLKTDRFAVRIVSLAPHAIIEGHINDSKRADFVYIAKGNVLVSFIKGEEYLSSGDGIFIKDTNPIRWTNKGGDMAELLLVW